MPSPEIRPDFARISPTIQQPVSERSKFSIILSEGSKKAAHDAKEVFESKLQELSQGISAVQEKPIWADLENVRTEELGATISRQKETISQLETKLREAQKTLLESSRALGKNEFIRLSQKCSKMQADLLSLNESLTAYQDLEKPEVTSAVACAKNAQIACQLVNRNSRKGKFDEISSSVGNITDLLAQISTQLATEKNETAIKILKESAELIQGTLEKAAENIGKRTPRSFSPRLFPNQKTINDLKIEKVRTNTSIAIQIAAVKKLTGKDHVAVLRLTYSGRSIHREQVKDLKASIKKISDSTSELLNKVATGKASETERAMVKDLQNRLKAAQDRYNALEMAIGKKASQEQFTERSICDTAIKSLQMRIKSLDALFSGPLEAFSTRSTVVVSQIGKALNTTGQERATAFYEACNALEGMELYLLSLQSKGTCTDPLALRILQSKIDLLRSQLETASATIFSLESKTAQAEQECAGKKVSRIALTEKEQRQVIPFLINAMTKLTLFDFTGPEANALRAIVDLCLHEMTQEAQGALPKELLKRYQDTTGPEKNGVAWKDQIEKSWKFIEDFDTNLVAANKNLDFFGNYKSVDDKLEVPEKIDALIRLERDLEKMMLEVDLSIYNKVKESSERLKKETPIELTREERKLIENLPKAPTFDEKRNIQLALVKLMFQARHHPDTNVRKQKKAEAIALMNEMGFNVEYQSVYEALNKQEIIKDFRKDLPPLPLPNPTIVRSREGRISTAKEWVNKIFTDSSSHWAQNIVSTDAIPFLQDEGEKSEVQEYITFHQDLALLKGNDKALIRKKNECSWEHAARLKRAYDHCSTGQTTSAIQQILLPYRDGLQTYMVKCFLTDDKGKIAQGIRDAAEEKETGAAKYYRSSIGREGSLMEGKRATKKEEFLHLDRIYRVLGPILIEAMQADNPTTVLEKYSFNTLVRELGLKAEGLENETFRTLSADVFKEIPAVGQIQKEMLTIATQMEQTSGTNPQEYFGLSKQYAAQQGKLNELAERYFGGALSLQRLKNHVVHEATKGPDSIEEKVQADFRQSKRMRTCVDQGKHYVQEQLQKLESLDAEGKKEFMLSDGLKEELLKIFTNAFGEEFLPESATLSSKKYSIMKRIEKKFETCTMN